ncbi:MAG: hypothetical protein IT416_02325 [Candidatus Pacebacteria bacterium]|nr:hypothetical protein [Candidatus Paceibacterota bacterium]
MSLFLLTTKLSLSLLSYLGLFLLEKIFVNKFFLVVNSLLTFLAVVFLLVINQTPSFIPETAPSLLIINQENTDLTQVSFTTQEVQAFLAQQNFTETATNRYFSQTYYLNLANLNLLAKDQQKADYFLKIARYINPNTDLIK